MALAALALGTAATAPVPARAADPACAVYVFFADGQATVGRYARDVLVRFARDYPGTPLNVTGYSDAAGTPAQNAALSLSRARSVAEALEGTEILSVTGAGAAVLPGTTGPLDPANRRVEARRAGCDARPVHSGAEAG